MTALPGYDALLLVSFGGPEGPDDVVPFLENVTRGRGIPRERLVEVGAHYAAFGGVSPINEQNRQLLAALQERLRDREIDVPVVWGNRNWAPYLTEAFEQLRDLGAKRVLAIVTSTYSSYSGCRQYRENLHSAVTEVFGSVADGPVVDKVRHYFDHPAFIEPIVDGVVASLTSLRESDGAEVAQGARLVFTTHSVPTAISDKSGPPGRFDETAGGAYVAQHRAVADLVTRMVSERLGADYEWDLVYQSRSGAPHIPWLEPDISDHLDELKAAGVAGAVMVPIGFVSDHMEVVWDLDTVALDHAKEIGLPCRRSATVGIDPRFVDGLIDLVVERASGSTDRPALTDLGPSWDVCPVACCANPRAELGALAGSDAV
jgi:ferrochelatase